MVQSDIDAATDHHRASDRDEAGSIRCAQCREVIADPADLFQTAPGADVRRFTNPHGVTFDVLTVLRTRGLIASGAPSSAFTWFPGHAWTITHCGSCGIHLGWRFDPLQDAAEAHTFWALILSRLTRD